MAIILVIDDEEMIRSLVEKILEKNSHTVLIAETGIEAISLFSDQSDTIELVIIDMQLDDLNGFEILTEFRKISAEIPAIISSGQILDKANIPENINKNIYFLPKPYKSTQLTEIVNSILALV